MKNKIKNLLDSPITGYQIEQETGVSQAVISKLRKGQREIGNITLDTAEKLLNYTEEIMKLLVDQIRNEIPTTRTVDAVIKLESNEILNNQQVFEILKKEFGKETFADYTQEEIDDIIDNIDEWSVQIDNYLFCLVAGAGQYDFSKMTDEEIQELL